MVDLNTKFVLDKDFEVPGTPYILAYKNKDEGIYRWTVHINAGKADLISLVASVIFDAANLIGADVDGFIYTIKDLIDCGMECKEETFPEDEFFPEEKKQTWEAPEVEIAKTAMKNKENR